MNNATSCLLALTVLLGGCRSTAHPIAPATAFGAASSSASLEAVIDAPGPIVVDTVVSATWYVDRSGLINLDHPKAKAAHLGNGDEPIELVFHAIRHPTRGLFLVDSGVERAFAMHRPTPSSTV